MLLLIFGMLLIVYLWKVRNPVSDANVCLHYVFSYIYLWTKRKCSQPIFNFDVSTKNIAQWGVTSLPNAIKVENPRSLQPDLNSVDSLSFHGVNQHGAAVSVQLDRRYGRVTEASVYLRLPSGEEYQLPSLPDSRVTNTDGRRFTAAGLTFQVLEPLRKWRVIFNGHLRKRIRYDYAENDNDDVLLVRFNFLWSPISNYLMFPEDFCVDYLSKILSTATGIKNVCRLSEHFPVESMEQCGQLYGTINIGDEPERKMLVRGIKKRKHGILNWEKLNYTISVEGYLNNGTSFHLFAENITGGIPNFVYGYVNLPCNMKIHHLSECRFDFSTCTRENLNSKDIQIKFVAGKRNYNLIFRCLDAGFIRMVGEQWQAKVTLTLGEVLLNGKTGHGAMELSLPENSRIPPFKLNSLPLLQETDGLSSHELVVAFRDHHCRSSKVVGGKGSSLAMMSSIEMIQGNFSVPKGMCVTQTAFALHLKEHPIVVEAIMIMERIAWKRVDGHLAEECQKVVAAMHETVISLRLKLELRKKLSDMFGNDFGTRQFAVRSSALGEDGEEMSAAGQNETTLGVKGFDQILAAIIKCWASQFAFRSVEYKRQNGQILNGGMGVVVQQMVPADVAGVLFSRDPLSGSLGKMILTANYGLGESVVSALADPDTIIISRGYNDHLSIGSKHIGKKNVMITMSENGTAEKHVMAEKSAKFTVSDQDALKLAEVALFLEKCFGTGRDIEWAIKEGDIFLLQSRPVTNENPMTEFEVFHENDTVMRTDEEHFTTANASEGLPGATSLLTATSAMRILISFMQSRFSYKATCHRFDPSTMDGMTWCFGHFLLDQIAIKAWVLEKEKSYLTKAMDIGLYGRILDDHDVCEKARERFENPPLSARIRIMAYLFRGMLFGWIQMSLVTNRVNNLKSPSLGLSSIDEIIESIESRFCEGTQVIDVHQQISMGSTLWNLLCFNLIAGGKELAQKHYTDFGNLIGAGNGTMSGEVPFRQRDLAKTIVNEEESATFCSMKQEEALKWLQNNTLQSGKKFRDFLQRHGHRGMKEFDLYCYSWSMDPIKLVKILQDTARYPKALNIEDKKPKDDVGSMKTQLSAFQKFLLSAVVRRAKSAVCQREQTKSWLIKFFDCIRSAYRQLAVLMVVEGYLPDEDLMFFMTHEEIKILIKTRSANLLRLAKLRHRAHPILNKLKFPEIMAGYPVPIDENEEVHLDNMNQITGLPVSKGIIKGPAKVVLSVENVHTIEPGDILIATATDIGWSPYFPMLGGVVTEIGGLISHGAVVAREFGLPCIVGAQHATKVFQSGDIVLLDANTGIISKVI